MTVIWFLNFINDKYLIDGDEYASWIWFEERPFEVHELERGMFHLR